MANEKTIAKKQAQVDELAKVLKDAKVVLLTDYRGITVTDVTKLRADLRNANAEYKVIKNNIIKRALDANGESALDEALEGPVALVIGNEDYLPSRQELLAKLAGALLGNITKLAVALDQVKDQKANA